jgi:diguanylate cyclase (GGDEF)-like protein
VKKPSATADEAARLAKLASLGIFYTPAEERFDRITRVACQMFDVPIALVTLLSESCQWYKSVQGLPNNETPRELSFCGHAILREEAMIIPDARLDPDFADNPSVIESPFIRFYAGYPLRYQGSPMGTLCLIDREPRQFSAAELDGLRSLAAWVESELQVSALSEAQTQLIVERDEARRDALLDPLTRTWNRKGLDELLPLELSHARRGQRRVALMLIDVDHFKQINDTYGHAAGDHSLREIAQHIRASVRASDVVVRYGGDEFLVFAGIDGQDTEAVLAERIRERTAAGLLRFGGESFPLSLSIGVASACASDDLEPARLIEEADEALYEAKAAGRNRVSIRPLAPRCGPPRRTPSGEWSLAALQG